MAETIMDQLADLHRLEMRLWMDFYAALERAKKVQLALPPHENTYDESM